MAMTSKQRAARIYVLKHAAAWLEEIETNDISNGPDGEIDEDVLREAKKVAGSLRQRASRLEQ